MKKLYILLFTILISSLSFGQVIITELADPNNDAGARFVELYCIGPNSVDLTDWELRRWTNAAIDPQASGIDLTSLGTLNPGEYAIIAANGTQFQTVYGKTADISAGTGGAADSNGDDKIALFDAADTTIDIFGTPGIDSNNASTAENFEDGRAERVASVSVPNATWTSNEWDSDNDQGFGSGAQDAPDGFDPGYWIGDPCGVAFGIVNYSCGSNTAGDNNDGVTINIPYSGSENSITSLSTPSGGTITGNDPASTPDGTISITGLMEGSAWDLTINGGDCDGTMISGTVPAAVCDPTASTCYDLSTGVDAFELVDVTPNSGFTNNGMWTYIAGTYAANAFCGGGCDEPVEGWLILGPLDMTGVTDLSLLFDAIKEFTDTDLIIAYTDSYSGCPSSSSWTTAETLTASGAYNVDLSGASGTNAFIGVQYVDDGAYSGWSLSNVELASFNNCPVLGTPPTSSCAACDLSLSTTSATCDAITAGADTYTATVDFVGGGTSTYTISSDFGSVDLSGGDPDVDASGTITITGINEGTDVTVTVLNGGVCNLNSTITSPTCDPSLTLPFTENFDYGGTAGDLIPVSGGIWTKLTGTAPISYQTTSLSMTGYAASGVGGSIAIADPGSSAEDAYTPFASQSSGSIYMSALVNIASFAGIGDDYFMFFNKGTSSLYCRLYAKDEGGNLKFGILEHSSGTSAQYAAANYLYNTTYLIVLKYDFSTGTSSVYILDNAAATEPVSPDAVSSDGTDIADLEGAGVRQGDNTPIATIDGIRVATSWSSAVLSTKNNQIEGFSFYPNPTNLGYVNISSKNSARMDVAVFDMLGKQVLNETVKNNTLDVSNLNTGLYIMKLSQDNATVTKKLVIQ